MSLYQERLLDGSSPVDLVVSLYDGIIRFLSSAADAVDRRDPVARRTAVKRALDIILHLQSRLRMDVGGKPAETLSEFYAAIFAQILQASRFASRPKFEHAIGCVRDVRDAWKQVAGDLNRIEHHTALRPLREVLLPVGTDRRAEDGSDANRWCA
jgi:flagellar protein FliS